MASDEYLSPVPVFTKESVIHGHHKLTPWLREIVIVMCLYIQRNHTSILVHYRASHHIAYHIPEVFVWFNFHVFIKHSQNSRKLHNILYKIITEWLRPRSGCKLFRIILRNALSHRLLSSVCFMSYLPKTCSKLL